MFEAHEVNTGSVFAFRRLDALVRRLGGTRYQVEAEAVHTLPERTVMVLRRNRLVGGWDIVTKVRMPSEAIIDTNAWRRIR